MRDKQEEELSTEATDQPNGDIAKGECEPLQPQQQQRSKTVSGTGSSSGDAPEAPSCELREVASQFVSDLIHRAREVAQRQQFRIDEVDEEDEEEDAPPPRRLTDITAGPVKTPPEIQVDLVGSRTPSPEEVVTYIAPERSTKKKVVVIHDEPSDSDGETSSDASPDSSPRAKLISEPLSQQQQDCKDIADLKNDPELREFAVAYIKGILEQAQVLAQERAPEKAEELVTENTALKKAAGPWYSRIRAAVTRCLRTGCLCVVRRQAPP
ncbi:uncharacterized protein LOC119387370 [Rhipicephalus sanguineus]|uniref:uncharacterized protein LOC119387370 n=1 Tax=Rhipicephalus sanguineus TaxID=34632 RepID=UPI001893AE06|nr:uncharacterized protein LOC119387370 [Rhipicephalus sanguineus]